MEASVKFVRDRNRRFERLSKANSSIACCRYGRSRNVFTIASDGGDVSFEATLQELDNFFLFPSRTFLLKDIYLDKFCRRAEKLWTSLCVDYVSEQRLVSLALTRTSTSAINS